MAHDHRHWILISSSDLANIDYSEICETSVETTQTNLAGDKAVIKWDSSIYDRLHQPTVPASVAAVNHLSDIMDHDEIKSELSNDEWYEEIHPEDPQPEE